MMVVMMVVRVSGQLALIARPPPRIPGSHSEAPGCQDTLGVTLVSSPHDDPFVDKF